MGRGLAGAAEAVVKSVQWGQRSHRAVSADDVGLDPFIGRGPRTAVILDSLNVIPRGGTHGQQTPVVAFSRVGDAAKVGRVCQISRPQYHNLNPLGGRATNVLHRYAKVVGIKWSGVPDSFVRVMSAAA